MSEITTQFVKPWSIKTPMLTRYMEEQYVEEFFEEGKLRISSFKSFRSNPDEEQGDTQEGCVSAQLSTPNGSHAILGINGQEAYVLCATTVESKTLEASFSTRAGFRIIDTLGFAQAISSHIPGFVAGLEGLCSYRDAPSVEKTLISDFPLTDSFPNPEVWAAEYEKFVANQSRDSYFLKRSRYSYQAEYRFIWFAQRNERDFIDIVCPEARMFCQPIPNKPFNKLIKSDG